MIFRCLIMVAALSLFAISAIAQKINIDLQISLNSAKTISKNTNVPVKLVLTNKSAEELDTSKLESFVVYLSSCSKISPCNSDEPSFASAVEISNKILKKDESIEFEINLADLHWNDSSSSFFTRNGLKNLSQISSSENKNFSVRVSVFDKPYANLKNLTKIPTQTSYDSNEITLSFK